MDSTHQEIPSELPLDVTPVSSSECLVPSRNRKRRAVLTCNLCGVTLPPDVSSTSHIVAEHMSPSFFNCTLCSFSSRAGFQGIFNHAQRMHKETDPDVVSNKVGYMAEINHWTKICFDILAKRFNGILKKARMGAALANFHEM